MWMWIQNNSAGLDIVLTFAQLVFDIIVVIIINAHFNLAREFKGHFFILRNQRINMTNPHEFNNFGGENFIKESSASRLLVFLDFKNIKEIKQDTFVGFAYRHLFLNNLKRYVKKGYSITFRVDKKEFSDLKSIKIEFKDRKNEDARWWIFKLEDDSTEYSVELSRIEDALMFWENIDELCITFLAYENMESDGTVMISDLYIKK